MVRSEIPILPHDFSASLSRDSTLLRLLNPRFDPKAETPMKHTLPLLLALAISPVAYAAQEPEAPVAAPAPSIDPAAAALLSESAKAYEALTGLSMKYAAFDQKGEKTSNLTGVISFSRPNKGQVTIVSGNESTLNLTDGTKFYSQIDAKTVQGTPTDPETSLQRVLARIPSAASVPVPVLIAGQSPLSLDYMKWQSVKLLPDNGVSLVATPGGPTLTFNFYFDPTDKLLRRVEFSMVKDGQKVQNNTTFTEVKANPQFAADEFSFKPGPGVVEVADVPMFDPKLKVGTKPFELKGKDLAGKAHPWKQYAGKVVLLDFWATWCGPCVGELPNVLKAYKTYKPKGFEIVGVSLDSEKKALTDFVKARDLKYPQIYDGKGWKNIDATSYGVRAVPFTLLIGKDGKIAAVNPRGEALEPAIKKALAQKVTVAQIPAR
ncbi:redoxin domain-containing protein [bacterium]|nr:MAG: redoxin domain-containing protein [bacterium]